MTLELIQGGKVEKVEPWSPNGECFDCGDRTPRAHSHPASGFCPRCEDCLQRLNQKILARSRNCPCDRTVHEPGGVFCQRRS